MPTSRNVLNREDRDSKLWKYYRHHELGDIAYAHRTAHPFSLGAQSPCIGNISSMPAINFLLIPIPLFRRRLVLPETRLYGRTQTDLFGYGQERIDELAGQSGAGIDDAVKKCIKQTKHNRGLLPSEIKGDPEQQQIESCLKRIAEVVDYFRSNSSKTLLGAYALVEIEHLRELFDALTLLSYVTEFFTLGITESKWSG